MLQLFLVFAKIGLFTFGGGYAMLSIIEDICVDTKKWITHEEMMNIIVIAESTPGPIAINCATFVGYKKKGLPGAIIATFGMLLPSFVIIYVIARSLDNLLTIPVVINAFKGIKLAVGILILDVAIKMVKKMKKKPLSCAIMVGTATMMLLINIFSLHFSSITLMLFAGIISLIFFIVEENSGKAGEKK